VFVKTPISILVFYMRAVLGTTVVEPNSGLHSKGGLLALLADIRLGQKWLEVADINYGPKCLIVKVP